MMLLFVDCFDMDPKLLNFKTTGQFLVLKIRNQPRNSWCKRQYVHGKLGNFEQ